MIKTLISRKLLSKHTLSSEITATHFFERIPKNSSAYLGIDPTANGLHLGHYSVIKTMQYLQKFGINSIFLMGGFTARIGDPSGKADERKLLDSKVVDENIIGITKDLNNILNRNNFENNLLLNNNDWLGSLNLYDYMITIGRTRVQKMMAQSSISNRMSSTTGLSYLELSYQLLQAYDFYYLYKTHNCCIEVGGNDQWCNILSGIDLINEINKKYDAAGITVPLITTKDGKKLGKTEGNGIWLNQEKTSNFEFYQYLLNLSDEDAVNLLTSISDYSINEISSFLLEKKQSPESFYLQNLLASKYHIKLDDLFRQIRGVEAFEIAKKVTDFIIRNNINFENFDFLNGEVPSLNLSEDELERTSLSKLIEEVNRIINNRGCYINNEVIENGEEVLKGYTKKYIILRKGKNKCGIIKII